MAGSQQLSIQWLTKVDQEFGFSFFRSLVVMIVWSSVQILQDGMLSHQFFSGGESRYITSAEELVTQHAILEDLDTTPNYHDHQTAEEGKSEFLVNLREPLDAQLLAAGHPAPKSNGIFEFTSLGDVSDPNERGCIICFGCGFSEWYPFEYPMPTICWHCDRINCSDPFLLD